MSDGYNTDEFTIPYQPADKPDILNDMPNQGEWLDAIIAETKRDDNQGLEPEFEVASAQVDKQIENRIYNENHEDAQRQRELEQRGRKVIGDNLDQVQSLRRMHCNDNGELSPHSPRRGLRRRLFGGNHIVPNKHTVSTKELIRREAVVGGQIFGPIPAGVERQFFCIDQHSWTWHEVWKESGVTKSTTTHYEVRPGVILKSQQGRGYHRVGYEESTNLIKAIDQYNQLVPREVYGVGA